MQRRVLLKNIFLFLPFIIFSAFINNPLFGFFKKKVNFRYVRPPGSKNEQDFLEKCIRCRECANVCDAGCIRFFDLSQSIALVGTPYLNTRLKSCNLCMNCTQVCPTGALTPIEKDIKKIAKSVTMGTAVVIEDNCLSFNGRICGVCHDACPIGGEAIVLESKARPKVIADKCIGCGRCEERCPQFPSAIIVYQELPGATQ